MYFSPEQARKAFETRQRDPALRRRVAEYVGELPEFLKSGPRAVLARPIATPNIEFHRFAQAARRLGLPSHCPEYTADLFCTVNPDKRRLAKMTFHQGKGRRGGERLKHLTVIDLQENNWRPFRAIETLWGEGFIEFHHRLMRDNLPEIEVSDCSVWLRRMGGTPEAFWPKHLALYVCHGILVDNFHTEGQERDFTEGIIRPAIRQVEELFGVTPLIVALSPLEVERESFWSWYPGQIEPTVRSMLNSAPAGKRGAGLLRQLSGDNQGAGLYCRWPSHAREGAPGT